VIIALATGGLVQEHQKMWTVERASQFQPRQLRSRPCCWSSPAPLLLVRHADDSLRQVAEEVGPVAGQESLKWLDRLMIAVQGVPCLEGPVEWSEGWYVLRIPLDAGGARLRRCCRRVSYVEDGVLHIVVPESVMKGIAGESENVIVDNIGGKLNITRST
jgi:hypothetical protein